MNGPDGRDATRNDINENNFQESQYRYKEYVNEKSRKLEKLFRDLKVRDDHNLVFYYYFYGEDGKDGIPLEYHLFR